MEHPKDPLATTSSPLGHDRADVRSRTRAKDACCPYGREDAWVRGWLLSIGCSIALAISSCATAPVGPDIGRLPAITSADPEAEQALREARAARDAGRKIEAEQRYHKFLQERPRDPLATLARLELGKLLLERGHYEEARELFRQASTHPWPAVAEQGRFYEAVALAKMGHSAEATRVLRDMVGRTVAPEDTGLLLLTLADAEIALDNVEGAAVALNQLMSDESNLPQDIAAARKRFSWLLEQRATPEQVNRMVDALPTDSPVYEAVLRRAVADAQVARDDDRIRELLGYFEDAGIPLDDDLRALALQAARPQSADPRAVGAILSLSGRARRVGELALRGLMLAADLPPSGPLASDAPRLVFRDDGGEPERAVRAVDELVNIHRVIAIIGPMGARPARAAAERAAELSVPLITLSPASGITDLGATIFQAFPTAAAEALALAAYARTHGDHRVAILHPDTSYGVAMRDLFSDAVQQLGGLEIVAVQHYPADDTAFGKQIARLSELAFDAVFVPDASDRIALLAPALAAAGLWSAPPGGEAPGENRAIQLLAPSVAFGTDLTAKSGRYLQGAVFTTPYAGNDVDEVSADFARRYQAQFGSDPDAIAAVAHDAYLLVRGATSEGARDRGAVAERLASQKAIGAVALRHGLGHERGPTMPIRMLQLIGDQMRETHPGPTGEVSEDNYRGTGGVWDPNPSR